MMTIHVDRIKLAMARKQMTQNDLARTADISHVTVSMIMSGKRCKPITLGKIAAALDVDPSEIYDE